MPGTHGAHRGQARPRATPRPTRPTTGWATPGRCSTRRSAATRSTAEGCRCSAPSTTASSYDNAFWDGTQMVFGDGDGTVFNRFTIAVDVIGHELTHGVTEHAAGLVYQGQSGALNESISDVFGSLVKQRVAQPDAAEADWLIGAGLFTDRVQGVALRSMKAPGHRLRRPRARQGPAAGDMADYVETTDDNGGVHINSGIPNHAFYLAATAIGGRAWEAAGPVWFDVLTGGVHLPPTATSRRSPSYRRALPRRRYAADSPQAGAVRSAWVQVGVLRRPGSPPRTAPAGRRPPEAPVPPDAPRRRRRRRRSGRRRRDPGPGCAAPGAWPVRPASATVALRRPPRRRRPRLAVAAGRRAGAPAPRPAPPRTDPRRLHLPRGVPPGGSRGHRARARHTGAGARPVPAHRSSA